MNKREKELLEHQLTSEERELRKLKRIYAEALSDIDDNIAKLLGRQDADLTHVIYRIDYQRALRGQISGILDEMNSKQFESITEYMADSYTNGFVGGFYNMAGEGIPIIAPIDQKQVVKAMRTDSKIDESLYTKLGKDTNELKKRISDALSRGIASGQGYNEIARNIANENNIGYNKAARIARTEGARVYNTASYDACVKAKSKGADVVKQWNSTLDGNTRPSHRRVDGEIRELDEKFSNGLMFPSDPAGSAAEVIQCRCMLMQRAKWGLDEEELETLKERAEYFGLDKTENFDDYKKKYLKASTDAVVPLDHEMEIKRKAAAEHFKGLGAEVDDNGIVTLYHATSKENVDKILEEGFKPTNAPINGGQVEELRERVFFGYDKNWVEDTWSSDGSYKIMTVKMPAEYLHQAGKNTSEVFVEGNIKVNNGIWQPDVKPTSTAWDRKLVKRWTANKEKALDNATKSSTIVSGRFNTLEDPMREVAGAGLASNPDEVNEIINEITEAGADIEYRPNAMGYLPSTKAGKAGKLIIDEEASYSAWMHEYTHFKDDQKDGYLGMHVFKDIEKCKQREIHAYDVEIELAKKANRPDIVERLEELKRKEVARYETNTELD